MLEASDVVLSFNGVGFDIPVLEGVSGVPLKIKEHLDLLQLIWEAVGKESGYKLTECAARTLGIQKNGDGLLAPQLAEDNKWAELLDYCLHDVHLTRNLFLYAQKHGGIIGTDGELLKLPFPSWFQDLKI
jgi:DEAD/DEAH box helicase domain-containing protein